MREYLIKAANHMGIEMSAEQANKFEIYHEMLISANASFNLTAVSDDVREACDRNYLDSLTLLKYIEDKQSLIDVGSGAGFPGIPIAIMRPDMKITLIDAMQKRTDFLNSVIAELNLNANAIHIRCEQAAAMSEYREQFDIAAARAVAQMNVLSEWLMPFVKVGGYMLAMKGPAATEETLAAEFAIKTLGGEIEGIFDTEIPDRDWHHAIVSVKKVENTPPRFPRRAGMAEKRPLTAK